MQRNVLVCNLLVICVAVCSFLSFVLIRTPVCSCLFVVSVCVSVCMCVKHHEEEDPKVPDKSAKKATPQAPPTAPAAHPQRAGAKIVVYSPGEQSSPLSQGFPPLYRFCTLSLSLSLYLFCVLCIQQFSCTVSLFVYSRVLGCPWLCSSLFLPHTSRFSLFVSTLSFVASRLSVHDSERLTSLFRALAFPETVSIH